MCGIAGIFHRNGQQVDATRLAAMTAALEHRGPDDSGTWVDGSVGLGHRRLAIRDLSAGGHQPQLDTHGEIVVSYNGEIYNYSQLRWELERNHGVSFRTTCDTEIIPAGYRAWGLGLLDKIEGMFAIAIWDRRSNHLILARDPLGIKPLFYSCGPQAVRFASEIKGMLAGEVATAPISAEGLHRFLAMGHAGPLETTLEGVRQVPPGTALTFNRQAVAEHCYWRPRRTGEITRIDDAVAAFVPLLQQVVADELASDVPVGILQSGGIDSSLLSASASRVRNLPLFVAKFEQRSFDETALAEEMAESIGAITHRVEGDTEAGFASELAEVVRMFDGQICDEAAVPLYILCREVRRSAKVALAGDGGDEFFAGYPTYRASQIAARLSSFLPAVFWRAVGRAAYRLGAGDETRLGWPAVLSRFASGTGAGGRFAHAYWRRLLPEHLPDRLYGPALRPLLGEDPFAGYRAAMQETGSSSLFDSCLLADQSYHLPGLLLPKSDIMSMAHGLELRVPLLNRRIIELAGRLDTRLLLSKRGEQKLVLRHSARAMGVPASICDAPKHGFNSPIARLLRGTLAATGQRLFDSRAATGLLEPYLRPEAVRALWREHLERRANHAYALWPIMHFALWRVGC